MSERTLTQPPARISAGRGMAPSTVVNLSLTKSFIWKEKREKGKGKGGGGERRDANTISVLMAGH